MTSAPTGAQKTSVVKEQAPIADIALIIDQSSSIGSGPYEEEIDFALQFVSSFPISADRTRFALIEFSTPQKTRVRLDWQNGTSLDAVQTTLNAMRHAELGTATDFTRALTVALDQLQKPEAGDRPEAPNVVVLITDGYFNSVPEKVQAFAAAHRLRNTGTLLYAIHVKLDPKIHRAPIDDLTEITANRSRVFAVNDFRRLTNELLSQITRQIFEEYQDCVFEYEPAGLCYLAAPQSSDCIQDASLKVIRDPQPPHGKACPLAKEKQIPCSLGSCQDSCEQWAWGPWEECISDNCGLNGTKLRHREGQPPYPKLITTCMLNESKACTSRELESLLCPGNGVAEQIRGAGVGGGNLPVWGIILIALICVVVIAAVITGVILYRSPRWRMVFIPTKPRKNQLPGNTSDTESTASL